MGAVDSPMDDDELNSANAAAILLAGGNIESPLRLGVDDTIDSFLDDMRAGAGAGVGGPVKGAGKLFRGATL